MKTRRMETMRIVDMDINRKEHSVNNRDQWIPKLKIYDKIKYTELLIYD